MGEMVTATASDSLCNIAVASGFANCDRLRAHSANVEYTRRPLQAGDQVYIPEITEGNDSAPTETVNEFVRPGLPMAMVRFVHGSPDRLARDDDTSDHLEVSNYRTDRAGRSGFDAFAGPNHWRYHAASHQDTDAFKVEVRDTRTNRTDVDVALAALHPIYVNLGGEFMALGADENWSSPAERTRRTLNTHVHRATTNADDRFRSAYLRLVVDDPDRNARSRQTLLTTDDQPNEEHLEILDQEVLATYLLDGCPAAGTPSQCRAFAQVPVGRDRMRIKICVGIFRANVGDAGGINGMTAADARYKVFRWFRRHYAQANMAPKLVAPGVRFLDPPERNLLTVSNLHGNPARGRRSSGRSPSRMSFTIATDRGGGVVVNKNVSLDIPRAATAAARQTPIQLANQLVALINDGDFEAESFHNPPSTNSRRTRRSADILVKDKLGGRVRISTVRSTDSAASLRLAIVNLQRVRTAGGGDMEYGGMQERLIMRNFDSGDDRLDCYVVGRFRNHHLHARAFSPCHDLDADYQPQPPAPYSIFLATRVMGGNDRYSTVLSHEAGHSLIDCFHSDGARRTELMFAFTNNPTGSEYGVRGHKRICDSPVRIRYLNYRSGRRSTRNFRYEAATRLHTLATGASSDVFEAW